VLLEDSLPFIWTSQGDPFQFGCFSFFHSVAPTHFGKEMYLVVDENSGTEFWMSRNILDYFRRFPFKFFLVLKYTLQLLLLLSRDFES
jgi:hypothetical protein